MRAVFDHAALLYDEDAIGQADGAEAVADKDDGALGGQAAETLEIEFPLPSSPLSA